MAYSQFSLKSVREQFGLDIIENQDLFGHLAPVPISDGLKTLLAQNVPLAQAINSEKARSELIIINVLLELKRQHPECSLFSGVDFTVDVAQGLTGFCDYLISQSSEQFFIEAPVITIVEAKNENIIGGLGQCIAEMQAARLFNEREKKPLAFVYGIVTTGVIWKFLKQDQHTVWIDQADYFINHPEKILGVVRSWV
jgi:hypothetical protein